MNASEALERYFLETRSKLLDIAANLDRVDRLEGPVPEERLQLIKKALSILQNSSGNRAEQIQMLFSRDYDETWIQTFPPLASKK